MHKERVENRNVGGSYREVSSSSNEKCEEASINCCTVCTKSVHCFVQIAEGKNEPGKCRVCDNAFWCIYVLSDRFSARMKKCITQVCQFSFKKELRYKSGKISKW
jgi:hypothetical protein